MRRTTTGRGVPPGTTGGRPPTWSVGSLTSPRSGPVAAGRAARVSTGPARGRRPSDRDGPIRVAGGKDGAHALAAQGIQRSAEPGRERPVVHDRLAVYDETLQHCRHATEHLPVAELPGRVDGVAVTGAQRKEGASGDTVGDRLPGHRLLRAQQSAPCLLYTSDAADDLLCV